MRGTPPTPGVYLTPQTPHHHWLPASFGFRSTAMPSWYAQKVGSAANRHVLRLFLFLPGTAVEVQEKKVAVQLWANDNCGRSTIAMATVRKSPGRGRAAAPPAGTAVSRESSEYRFQLAVPRLRRRPILAAPARSTARATGRLRLSQPGRSPVGLSHALAEAGTYFLTYEACCRAPPSGVVWRGPRGARRPGPAGAGRVRQRKAEVRGLVGRGGEGG